MSNNRLDGFQGQTDIAKAIRGLRDGQRNTVFELNRIANALERANEIHINSHALPVEVFDEVQADREFHERMRETE